MYVTAPTPHGVVSNVDGGVVVRRLRPLALHLSEVARDVRTRRSDQAANPLTTSTD